MATTEFYTDLDIKGQQIKNARVEVYTTPPTTASKPGMFAYYDGVLYYSDKTNAFVSLATVGSVTTLEGKLTTLNDIVTKADTGLVDKVTELQEQVGITGEGPSLGTRVTQIETDLNAETTGIKARLTATETVANNAASAAATNADNITANANDIASLQNKVGDSTKGLVKDVDDLQKVVGDASSGLVKSVATNTSDIATLKSSVSTNTSDIAGLKTSVATNTANIDTKVDKVVGYGLSKNDFTDALKGRLEGIEEGAEVNIIETVKVNGTALTPDGSRAVDIDLSNYATKESISSVYKPMGTVASTTALPSDAAVGDVYNVETAFTGDDGQVYPAGTNVVRIKKTDGTYVWDPLGGQWDTESYYTKTQVDNSLKLKADKADTYTKTQVDTALGDKVDKLAEALKPTAGTFTKVTINTEGQVTKGENLVASDIPALDAAKITTGTFDVAKIPDLDADKIATGILTLDRIPTIPSTKLGVVAEDKLALQVKTQAVTAGAASYTWAHGFKAEPYIVQVVKGGKVIIGLDVTYNETNIVVSANDALESGFVIKAIGPRNA